MDILEEAANLQSFKASETLLGIETAELLRLRDTCVRASKPLKPF